MSETPELTTRDVLQQIDRRLTHLEQLYLRNDRDHGSLDAKIDDFRTGPAAKLDNMRIELGAKLDRDFRWTIGLILASWMSMMSALLLK